jgi:hypothetical protein
VYDAAVRLRRLLPGFDVSAGVRTVELGARGLAVRSGTQECVLVIEGGAEAGCWLWAAAAHALPHIEATERADWCAMRALAPQAAAPAVGDAVGLRGVPGHAELDGCGAWVDPKGRAWHGAWHVRPVTREGRELPVMQVPAKAVAPLHGAAPFLGVSLECLRAFAAAHGAQCDGATTQDICDRVIKPLTAAAGASLAACLRRLGAGASTPYGTTPHAAPPTVFVSHSREYVFADLLAALEAFAAAQPSDAPLLYCWIDIFSLHQPPRGAAPPPRHAGVDVTAQLAVTSCSHTCLVLSSARAPLPLRRAWVLWELWCTLVARARLSVQVPPAEAAAFERALVDQFGAVDASIAAVDASAAECADAADALLLCEAIDASVGHAELSRRVVAELRSWLASAARAALTRLPTAKRLLSPLISNLARALLSAGKLDEAEPLAVMARDGRRAALGDRHESTLTATLNLAMVRQAQRRSREAVALGTAALAGRRDALGDAHPQTLVAAHSVPLTESRLEMRPC